MAISQIQRTPGVVHTDRNPVLQLSIGFIRCSFRGLDEAFRAVLSERYRAFESSGPSKYEFIIDIRPLSYFMERDCVIRGSPQIDAEVHNKKETVAILRASIPVQVFLNTGTGQGIARMVRSPHCFDQFLRILYSMILGKEDGILLHSAAISLNGEGRVFLGPSGSRDAILSNMSEPQGLLTDELALIRLWKGGFHVFSTPFRRHFLSGLPNFHAPLRGLFFLRKDTRNYLSSLPAEIAAQELQSWAFSFARSGPMDESFQTCCALAESVPVRELHFLPRCSFGECLEALMGQGFDKDHERPGRSERCEASLSPS